MRGIGGMRSLFTLRSLLPDAPLATQFRFGRTSIHSLEPTQRLRETFPPHSAEEAAATADAATEASVAQSSSFCLR